MAVAERWPLVEVRLYSIDYKHKSNLSESKLRLSLLAFLLFNTCQVQSFCGLCCAAQIELFFFFSESEAAAESATGAPPGLPVTKRTSMAKSGSKPSIVTPLENIEVNPGDNITLQVNSGGQIYLIA